jgi:hypothetical protein
MQTVDKMQHMNIKLRHWCPPNAALISKTNQNATNFQVIKTLDGFNTHSLSNNKCTTITAILTISPITGKIVTLPN